MLSILHKLFPSESFSIDDTLFIVGAGASMDSHLPGGADLISYVLNYFSLPSLADHIRSINNDFVKSATGNTAIELYSLPRLEALFNTLQQSLTKEQYEQFLTQALFMKGQEVRANLYHRLLAEFLHAGGSVLTFNFDQLVEVAYEDLFGEELQNICIFPLESHKQYDRKGLFVKAHGCISIPDKIGMTLNNLSMSGFPESSHERAVLDLLFHSKIKHFVSLGYSFSDSFDVTPYLREKCHSFQYYHFQFSPKDTAFRVVKLSDGIDPKLTYKYVLNSILGSKSDDANVIFHNKKSFLQEKGADWTGSRDVRPTTLRSNPIMSPNSPEYSLAYLKLIYDFGLSEFQGFDKSAMGQHRRRVLLSGSIPFKKRLSILSCYLNRDRHYYLLHSLLFFLNILLPLYPLLTRVAFFHGTLIELVFVSHKFPGSEKDNQGNQKKTVKQKVKDIIKNFYRVIKGSTHILIGLPLLVLSEIIIGLSLLICKAFGVDKSCAQHRPPKDDYLIALRRFYQPLYKGAEVLHLNIGITIPGFHLRVVKKLISKCEEIARRDNNLIELRYIWKDRLMLPVINDQADDKNHILEEFDKLIRFNADTDYFIEVRNVLKKKEIANNMISL